MGRDVVSDFWQAVDSHDWDLLATTISDDFVRIGMKDTEEDTCRGKESYLEFVSKVTGKMDFHELRNTGIFYSQDRRHAVAECIETIRPPGEDVLVMKFMNLHDLNEDGLISKLDIYWKTQVTMPPDWIEVDAVLNEGS
jgi:hypothetical protein